MSKDKRKILKKKLDSILEDSQINSEVLEFDVFIKQSFSKEYDVLCKLKGGMPNVASIIIFSTKTLYDDLYYFLIVELIYLDVLDALDLLPLIQKKSALKLRLKMSEFWDNGLCVDGYDEERWMKDIVGYILDSGGGILNPIYHHLKDEEIWARAIKNLKEDVRPRINEFREHCCALTIAEWFDDVPCSKIFPESTDCKCFGEILTNMKFGDIVKNIRLKVKDLQFGSKDYKDAVFAFLMMIPQKLEQLGVKVDLKDLVIIQCMIKELESLVQEKFPSESLYMNIVSDRKGVTQYVLYVILNYPACKNLFPAD